MEHTFIARTRRKFPVISGTLKRMSCFLIGSFSVGSAWSIYEFSLEFTISRRFTAISVSPSCEESEGNEWNFVTYGTRSALVWTFLLNLPNFCGKWKTPYDTECYHCM